MGNRKCYLFVFDGFADWEPSHVIAGLSKYSDFEIKTFSIDGANVRSMGGLNIVPDFSLNDVIASDFNLLILPGGTLWEENGNMQISQFVQSTFESNKTIAAICAATLFMAKIGLLNEVKHTSNGLEYLRSHYPNYSGSRLYKNRPCIEDKNIITANGAAMLEFAYAIFDHFQIFSKIELTNWFDIYKSAGSKL